MAQNTKTEKFHYAWIILITVAVMFAFTAGTLLNCSGLFHTAICEDTGWKYSDYISSNLLYGIGSMVALLFVNKLFRKFSIKWMLVLASVVFSLGYASRAFMNSIAGFAVLNFIIGIAGAFLIYVPIPILVSNWFYKSRGLALGLAGMASGIGGAIASPILAAWINEFGWRKASLLNGGISIALLVPLLIIFLADRPEDKGLKPFGYEAFEESVKAMTEKLSKGETGEGSASHRHYASLFNQGNTNSKVILCVIFAFLTQLFATLFYQFSNYTIDLGYGLGLGATMVSVCMVGNVAGKSLQGICMDRFGKRRTTLAFLILVMISILTMLLAQKSKAFLFVGAVGVGISSANTTIMPPLLVDTFSRGSDYAKNVSKVTFGTYIGAMFASYIPGILREAAGSYSFTFILYAAMHLICIAIAIWLLKGKDWA